MSDATISKGTVASVRRTVISTSTYVLSGLLAALLTAFYFLNAAAYAETITGKAADYIYSFGIALPSLAAGIVLLVAFSIGVRESVGRQWLLIGLGALAFAFGDIAWMIIELFLGLDPYPSVADIFYPLQYVFFIWAMIVAIRSYRGFFDLRRPLFFGMAVSFGSAALVYLAVLRPYVFAAGAGELGFWGLLVSTLYPLGDTLFMLGPAVALALTIGHLGTGRFAWPWWIVVIAALVFTLTDSYYSYADWSGIGTTAVLDLGWIAAQMLFAVAALVARDVYRS